MLCRMARFRFWLVVAERSRQVDVGVPGLWGGGGFWVSAMVTGRVRVDDARLANVG
jgi:hypothetical protein